MKITQLLFNLKKPAFSFELMPEKGTGIFDTLQTFEKLLQKNPVFVDIPYHPDFNKPVFSEGNDTDFILQKPSTEELSRALLTKYKLVPLAHLLCRNFTPEQTEEALKNLTGIGVENVLLVRGDKVENRGRNDFPGHKFAYELVQQVLGFNRHKAEKENQAKPGFCIGVAGYPEKHAEAKDYKTGLLHLKQKQDAGADFILTQLFYDNNKFYRFREACVSEGINIPVIPAIGPLTTRKRLALLPDFFNVSLPVELQNLISKADSDKAFREIGISWAKKQAEDLLKSGEKLVHFYAFNEPDATHEIVADLF